MVQAKVRIPQVAGQFYPAEENALTRQISSFLGKGVEKIDAIACMLPHAGYMYSGRVASETVSSVKIKDKIILLGPNHTGNGALFSIMTEGTWQTPFGSLKIDTALAKEILRKSKNLEEDSLAHLHEHSLEVELPILQFFKKDFQIVPIAFLSDNVEKLKETGREIAAVIKELGLKDSILIVASSDMTHYESEGNAQRKDKEAIDAILELNEDALMQRVLGSNISMCGFAPVITMLSLAKSLGAKAAKLIKYQTSGDITGDRDSVVGYAGIVIY